MRRYSVEYVKEVTTSCLYSIDVYAKSREAAEARVLDSMRGKIDLISSELDSEEFERELEKENAQFCYVTKVYEKGGEA